MRAYIQKRLTAARGAMNSWKSWPKEPPRWRRTSTRRIEENSEHWRLDRMPTVDRNILRLAIFEMTKSSTPPAVIIDEALELARQFSGEESVGFINGVLDAVNKNRAATAWPQAGGEPM